MMGPPTGTICPPLRLLWLMVAPGGAGMDDVVKQVSDGYPI
jgi:hypothetical protein